MKHIKPLSILLAEDNADHAELIVDTLQEFQIGNKVVHVENGEQAIEYLNSVIDSPENYPHLILLDLKMPRMDGPTSLTHIRAIPQFRGTPVIMVSTSMMESDIEKCYALGANSYITKPLQFEEFTRKIRDLNLYWVLTSEIPS